MLFFAVILRSKTVAQQLLIFCCFGWNPQEVLKLSILVDTVLLKMSLPMKPVTVNIPDGITPVVRRQEIAFDLTEFCSEKSTCIDAISQACFAPLMRQGLDK